VPVVQGSLINNNGFTVNVQKSMPFQKSVNLLKIDRSVFTSGHRQTLCVTVFTQQAGGTFMR